MCISLSPAPHPRSPTPTIFFAVGHLSLNAADAMPESVQSNVIK